MVEHVAPFDARDLRTALGSFVTGVTVITTRDSAGIEHGLTANSFNTVSLDPPLILWSQSKRAGSYEAFRQASEFAVSILAEDQIDISGRFATKHANKFDGVAIDHAFCGLPVVANSSTQLHCKTVSRVDGGDHTIYVGEILKIGCSGARPLVFGQGRYLLAQPHHGASGTFDAIPSGERQQCALRLCRTAMQRIVDEIPVAICASVWGNHGPTVVAWESHRESPIPSFPMGLVLSVTESAAGKALAAHLPGAEVDGYVAAELAAGDGATVEAWQRWKDQLTEIRKCGIAFQGATRLWNADPMISAAGIAIRDAGGLPVAALSIVVEASAESLLVKASERMHVAVSAIEQRLGCIQTAMTTEALA